MNYTPTEKELEELGFEGGEHGYAKFATPITFITFTKNTWLIGTKPIHFMGEQDNRFRNIYLQSLDDLKTLIRILTPQ